MTWPIPRNRALPFRPAGRPLAVTCRSGRLVVTQEGDPLDHVLGRGEGFLAAPRGLVVVWALSDGAVAVEPWRAAA